MRETAVIGSEDSPSSAAPPTSKSAQAHLPHSVCALFTSTFADHVVTKWCLALKAKMSGARRLCGWFSWWSATLGAGRRSEL